MNADRPVKRRKRHLFSNEPIPRRSLYRYRLRREAALQALHGQGSDSEGDGLDRVHPQDQDAHTDLSSSNGSVNSDDDMNVDNNSTQESEHDEPGPPSSDESNNIQSQGEGDCNSEESNQPADGSDGSVLSDQSEYSERNEDADEILMEGNVDDIDLNENGEPNQPNIQQILLADPLCPCTTTTEGDALLMCLAVGMRHNLSWVAIVDMLKLINNLFGKEVVHSSKYYLMKFFDETKKSADIHLYCPKCEKHLGTRDFVIQHEIVNCTCGEVVNQLGPSSSFFVTVNLEKQYKKLMEIPDVASEIMTYRFQRRKVNEDAYEDIYDGEGYKKFSAPGQPLSDPKNFSITMNTDGMALGTSSSRTAWPIFMYINELSPRNRKKHIIFAGIWVGKKQPNMTIFLRPFIDSLMRVCSNGFLWVDSNREEQRSRVLPLLAVLDSGARYKFLNLTSYAGYYGCTLCYQKAENTIKGRRFTVTPEDAPLRTHESMMRDMQRAHANRNHRNEKERTYKGCKGYTPLVYCHPFLNLGSAMIVDILHNALLGVARSNTDEILHCATAPYYAGSPDKLHTMNSRLEKIRPPKSISRTPRPLKDMKVWKGSEWRSFLLFYGLVCYGGVLKDKYLEHFALLSSAFHILLQKSISRDNLEVAENYLRKYVFLTQEYYGKLSMRYNIHLLLHVSAAVKDWGPPWGPNTFIFEGENRHLSQMNTSPGQIALQLTRRYQIFTSFPKLCEKYASSETPVNFIQEITGRNVKSFLRCGETVLLGKGKDEMILTEDECDRLRSTDIAPSDRHVHCYSKIIHGSVRYTTRLYSEGKKNDDSWVKLHNGTRGFIDKILCVSTLQGQVVVLLLQTVNIDRLPVLQTRIVCVKHLKKVGDRGPLIFIKPIDITMQCIYMESDSGKFIVDIPYGCYGD